MDSCVNGKGQLLCKVLFATIWKKIEHEDYGCTVELRMPIDMVKFVLDCNSIVQYIM